MEKTKKITFLAPAIEEIAHLNIICIDGNVCVANVVNAQACWEIYCTLDREDEIIIEDITEEESASLPETIRSLIGGYRADEIYDDIASLWLTGLYGLDIYVAYNELEDGETRIYIKCDPDNADDMEKVNRMADDLLIDGEDLDLDTLLHECKFELRDRANDLLGDLMDDPDVIEAIED